MATKRDATEQVSMDIESMSTEDKAALIALLTSDKEAVKLATEEHSVAFKVGAYRAPQPKPDSKKAKLLVVFEQVNTLFATEYEQAHSAVTEIAAEAYSTGQRLCAEKGIEWPTKTTWSVKDNGDGSTGYILKRKGGSTPIFDPGVYKLNGHVGENATQLAIVTAFSTFDEGYNPTSKELKIAMGLTSNANIQGDLGVVCKKVATLTRSEAEARIA